MNEVKAVSRAIDALLSSFAKSATVYLAPDRVVRVTRWGRFPNKVDRRHKLADLRVQIGKPNYAACQFIKNCKKAGESFPVRKVQVKFYPTKRK